MTLLRPLVLLLALLVTGCGLRKVWVNPNVTSGEQANLQLYECQRDAGAQQYGGDPVLALLVSRNAFFEHCMAVHGYAPVAGR